MTINIFELNYNEDGLNVLSKVAREGDSTAVAFLEEQGQGINLKDAAYGYALGGQYILLDDLLLSHPELTTNAARGFARRGDEEKIVSLPNTQEIKQSLICGYGEAGNLIKIRELLSEPQGVVLLPDAIKGLATTNQYDLLAELVSNTNYYPVALKYAAKAGHHHLVKNLLSDMGIEFDKLSSDQKLLTSNVKRYLAYVLEGYTEGGHCLEALQIMSLGINPMFCLNQLMFEDKIRSEDVQPLLSLCTDKALHLKLETLLKEQFNLVDADLKIGLADEPKYSLTIIDRKIKDKIKAHSSNSSPQNFL